MSPIAQGFSSAPDVTCVVVHTGQHDSAAMSRQFEQTLGVRVNHRIARGSGGFEGLASQVLPRLGAILRQEVPDLVVVLGDTDSALLGALEARRLGLPVAHVEAGLRSYNETSAEEVNRRILAQVARVHFAPTALNRQMLLAEHVDPARIFVVGNPVVDVIQAFAAQARRPAAPVDILFTAHRAQTVDDPESLATLVAVLHALGHQYRVLFPVHPRTRQRLEEFGLWETLRSSGAMFTEPLSYPELIGHLLAARCVVTDSGGLQEEAVTLGRPVLVLRRTTPRWEGVLGGPIVLGSLDRARILATVDGWMHGNAPAPAPDLFGDGQAAARIVQICRDLVADGALSYTVPDLSYQSGPATLGFLRNQLGEAGA